MMRAQLPSTKHNCLEHRHENCHISATGRDTMPPETLQDRIPTTNLTDEEAQTLAAVATGMTTDPVGRRLGISDRTVRRRIRDVCDPIGVDTTVEAVTWAAKHRLI